MIYKRAKRCDIDVPSDANLLCSGVASMWASPIRSRGQQSAVLSTDHNPTHQSALAKPNHLRVEKSSLISLLSNLYTLIQSIDDEMKKRSKITKRKNENAALYYNLFLSEVL